MQGTRRATRSKPAMADLSKREQQVAALVARGYSNGEIAHELELTTGTVANHVEHVLVKLGLNSRAALAGWAIERRVLAIQERYLAALERLLGTEAIGRDGALEGVAEVLVETLAVDDVDLFVHRPDKDSLVAIGGVETLLHRQQRLQGLMRLPLAQGGRIVEVFRTGEPYVTGHAEEDAEMLVGFTRGLGIRSMAAVPWEAADGSGGVVALQATRPDAFDEHDLRFLRVVARCIGRLVLWSGRGGPRATRSRRGTSGRRGEPAPQAGRSAA